MFYGQQSRLFPPSHEILQHNIHSYRYNKLLIVDCKLSGNAEMMTGLYSCNLTVTVFHCLQEEGEKIHTANEDVILNYIERKDTRYYKLFFVLCKAFQKQYMTICIKKVRNCIISISQICHAFQTTKASFLKFLKTACLGHKLDLVCKKCLKVILSN